MVFMSESQGFFKETTRNLALARTNRLPGQRDMGSGEYAFEKQVPASANGEGYTVGPLLST